MNRFTTVLLILAAFVVQAVTAHASPPAYPYTPVIGALEMALDASYIDTSDTNQVVVRNGVTYVKVWMDYSGDGNVAAQTVAAMQPIYVPNGANGLPVVQFDGLAAYMTTTLAQIKGNKSIFIVEKRSGNALATEIASSSGSNGMFLGNNYGGGFETEGRINVAQDMQVASPANHFILKSFILSGSTGTLRVNGTATSATVTDSAAGNYTISYPGYLRFGGQIAEILIYNNAMTDSQRQSIESYLTDKWGLQDTLPPVTSGLKLRLAANTIDTSDTTQILAGTSGTFAVADWRDSSGNGLHATQPITINQPVLVPGALNGRPVVQFDGKYDYLNTTLAQITGDKSIFIVQRRVGTQLRTELASTSASGGMYLGNGYTPYEAAGRLNVAQDVALMGYLNGFVLKSFVRSGSLDTLMVNDTSSTVSAPDAASGNYAISAPMHYQFAGQIAEVLIYNRAVTEAERQSIENYLSQKYGLWNFSRPVQSGLVMSLAADSIETGTFYQLPQVTLSGTQPYVTLWPDRSQSGFDATQTTLANQPLYAPNAWYGHPFLRFNTSNISMTTAFPQLAGNKSIFVLERRRGTQAGREISSTSSTSGHVLASSGTNETKGTVTSPAQLQVPWQFYQTLVKAYVRSGTNETLSITGTAISTATSSTTPDSAAGNYTLSDSRAGFIGDFGEALIYGHAVNSSDQLSITNYLVDKWSHYPNDLFSVSPDLQVPSDTITTTPAAGVCAKMTTPVAPYAGTAVYNTLYLPTDWTPGKTYPVIVEFPPNGGYSDTYGGVTDSVSTGNVEDCQLGYGISGGQGYIVIGMPCIGGNPLTNQTTWWGNVSATKDYCLKTIQYVCQQYGGDSSQVILAGFSRGAAACNYIGLNDATIADTWLAFIPHSGYDYEEQYGAPWDSEETGQTAAQRLGFLNGRAQYVSQGSVIAGDWEVSAKYFLQFTGINLSAFTFRTIPYENHSGAWALRPIQMRRDVRAWLQNILVTRPGTYSITGIVTDPSGNPIAGALVQTGTTHFTYTAANGTYTLASLVNSSRTVSVTTSAYTFTPQAVTVANANVPNINFQAGH